MSAEALQEMYISDASAVPPMQPKQLFYPVIDGVVLPKTPVEAFFFGESVRTSSTIRLQ
jgi:hypothetical protein